MSARSISYTRIGRPFIRFGSLLQSLSRPVLALPYRRYILCVSPLRATLEIGLSGAALFFALAFVWSTPPDILVGCYFYSFVGLVCPIVGGFRLRLTHGVWWQRALTELAVLTAMLLLLNLSLPPTIGLPYAPGSFANNMIRISNIYAVMFFVVTRLTIRLWLALEGLRRKHLRWSLTHAYSMGLIFVILAASLPFTIVGQFGEWLSLALARSGPPMPVIVILLLIFGLCNYVLVSLLNLAVFFPPFAFLSYLVAKRVTHRLEALTRATSALKTGTYTTRVVVDGTDEIAQLQQDFNVMSAALEDSHAALQAERDRVTTLLNVRRELVATVSHELRTPVTTMRGYLESALARWDDTPPDTLRHDLTVIESEVIRLQTLIDDLFVVARADSGHLSLNCCPADIGAMVARLVEASAPLAWGAGRVQIVADVAQDLPLAQADESRVEQIVSNLIRNATRHTPPGGIVAVGVTAEPDMLRIEVRDTGEGIAPVDLPHIWERFFRAENARMHDIGGAGLGLTLVKELTEAMGGSVGVESRLGVGSCFVVRLPRA